MPLLGGEAVVVVDAPGGDLPGLQVVVDEVAHAHGVQPQVGKTVDILVVVLPPEPLLAQADHVNVPAAPVLTVLPRQNRSVEPVDDDVGGPTHVGGKGQHVTKELRGDKTQVSHIECQLGHLPGATGIPGDEPPLAEGGHERVVRHDVQPGCGHRGGDASWRRR